MTFIIVRMHYSVLLVQLLVIQFNYRRHNEIIKSFQKLLRNNRKKDSYIKTHSQNPLFNSFTKKKKLMSETFS